MTNAADLLSETLHEAHQSFTAPRRVVFDMLLSHEPQTMHELIQRCAGSVDRASVYRAVGLFDQLGIIQKIHMGWKYKVELSDRFSKHHHHMSCRRCSRIIPLPADEQLEQRLNDIAAELHFAPEDHQVEIRGLCSNCKHLVT